MAVREVELGRPALDTPSNWVQLRCLPSGARLAQEQATPWTIRSSTTNISSGSTCRVVCHDLHDRVHVQACVMSGQFALNDTAVLLLSTNPNARYNAPSQVLQNSCLADILSEGDSQRSLSFYCASRCLKTVEMAGPGCLEVTRHCQIAIY